jgi:hypothetical protein
MYWALPFITSLKTNDSDLKLHGAGLLLIVAKLVKNPEVSQLNLHNLIC